MNNIVDDLKSMVEKRVDPGLFPVEKGAKILIGSRTVIQGDEGYTVFNENKQPIMNTHTKIAALAAARSNRFSFQEISRLDKLIDKKVTDCVFYEAARKKNKDQTTLSILMQDSRMHIKDCREKLESFIYQQAK